MKFVSDQQQQVLFIKIWLIESSQCVVIQQELQVGVDVAPLGGKTLRHRYRDNRPSIELRKRKGIRLITAKHVGNIAIEEKPKIGLDGTFNGFPLLVCFH